MVHRNDDSSYDSFFSYEEIKMSKQGPSEEDKKKIQLFKRLRHGCVGCGGMNYSVLRNQNEKFIRSECSGCHKLYKVHLSLKQAEEIPNPNRGKRT